MRGWGVACGPCSSTCFCSGSVEYILLYVDPRFLRVNLSDTISVEDYGNLSLTGLVPHIPGALGSFPTRALRSSEPA